MNTSSNVSTLGAITLNRVFGFKPAIAHAIIEKFGTVSNFFSLPEKERDSVLPSDSPYKGKLGDAALEESLKELNRLSSIKANFISIEDDAYPALLRLCNDAPPGFYYKSNTPARELFSQKMTAIVGTRDVTPYGKQWCRNIVHTLAQAPIKTCIVSGLALGVDGIAHESALGESLGTIAVLPTGIETFYPRYHYSLAERLASTANCALISDFPIGYPATAANFLRRNRIIAGLCGSTLVIESKKHGGSLITARLAQSYGRDIFALPGRIDDIHSQGCNNLLEEKLAEPIANLQTLSYRLGLGRTTFSKEGTFAESLENFYAPLPPEMLEDILKIGRKIQKERGIDLETLSTRCELTYSRVLSLCTMMQKDAFLEIDLLQRCHILTKNK